MLIDIVLSKVPFPYGKSASVIMRVPQPTSVTWETIFAFIEKQTNMPRILFAGTNSKGKYIYGKSSEYPPWNYDNYRLCNMNGKYMSSAIVNIHFTPCRNSSFESLKKKH